MRAVGFCRGRGFADYGRREASHEKEEESNGIIRSAGSLPLRRQETATIADGLCNWPRTETFVPKRFLVRIRRPERIDRGVVCT
jgi:hypothetical protein